jgi:hypothetical protein
MYILNRERSVNYNWLFFQGFFRKFVFFSFLNWFKSLNNLKRCLKIFRKTSVNILLVSSSCKYNEDVKTMAKILESRQYKYNGVGVSFTQIYWGNRQILKNHVNAEIPKLSTFKNLLTFTNQIINSVNYHDSIVFVVGSNPPKYLLDLLCSNNMFVVHLGLVENYLRQPNFSAFPLVLSEEARFFFFKKFIDWFISQVYFTQYTQFKNYNFRTFGKNTYLESRFTGTKNATMLTWVKNKRLDSKLREASSKNVYATNAAKGVLGVSGSYAKNITNLERNSNRLGRLSWETGSLLRIKDRSTRVNHLLLKSRYLRSERSLMLQKNIKKANFSLEYGTKFPLWRSFFK